MENKPKTHWLYLAGFFIILFLPLLSLPPIFSPPDWGKVVIFRIVFPILLFFFVYQVFSKKFDVKEKFKAIPKNLRILLISLLGIFFLATLFSQNVHFSFWGSPHRSGGFLNFAFYVIFAFLSYLIFTPRDWKKIWNFSFVVGILVGLIAVLQKYELFGKFLLPYYFRPASTIGGPIFLGIYLMLLFFLALSFAVSPPTTFVSKVVGGKSWKRLFYLFSALFFLFIVFLSATRAAYFGGVLGFIYFLFFYPLKSLSRNKEEGQKKVSSKDSFYLKILAGILLLSAFLALFWLNSQPKIPDFIEKNKILSVPAHLLIIGENFLDARWPGWKVTLQSLEDKPIFGYGPENFSIGFDKYYDPSLPYITQTIYGAGTGWWDRAHNWFLEIPVTAGIPALLVYLALFVVLFIQLQKLKKTNENPVIIHGLQATFIAYLAANFFSFDSFSSYLISFLLIGYSLYLIKLSKNSSSKEITFPETQQNYRGENLAIARFSPRYRKAILFILFIILIWFIWVSALKPLHINTQANMAEYQSEHGDCPGAINRMEKLIKSHSILDHHIRLKYVDIIGRCIGSLESESAYQLGLRAYQIMKENAEIMPSYTRNWIILGIYSNYLAEKLEEQNPEQAKRYLDEAISAFEKSEQLSPKRQEPLMEWAKAFLLAGQPKQAKEKTQECLNINPEFRDCWWLLAIANIYLDEKEEAAKNIAVAQEKGLDIESEASLLQIAKAYIYIKDYQSLIPVYQKLIKIDQKNPQYLASLATVFREAGDFENARIYALKLIDLVPSSQAEVEAFLQSLR